MKKILLTVLVLGTLFSAQAGSRYIYIQDWGTTNSGSSLNGSGNIGIVGWAGAVSSQTAGPYLGIYPANGANDPGTGSVLPANTVFLTGFPGGSAPGMFYTTDASGPGSGGDSSFVDINPTLYTNLAFNVEVRETGSNDTNYFAVQVGGQWYVATSFTMPVTTPLTYPAFTNETLIYTNSANVWQSLTINGTTNVTIGGVASPDLTATITGIGIVELPTGQGFNYNMLSITAFTNTTVAATKAKITAPAVTPQSSFLGGGASFAIRATGTQPLTYIWETNGVPIGNDPRFIGATNNTLTITNLNAADALATYSIIVTNIAGSDTNGSLGLSVSNVPPNLLYAEIFPYSGPVGAGNLSIAGNGWVSSSSAATVVGIYQASSGGLGDVFSYSPSATTNIYYTTDTNNTGLSGLQFTDINPANYPAISFQAGFVPGNAAGQVSGAISVYWAVDMGGTWYCSAQPQTINLSALSPYQNYQYGFNPAKTNWNNLTITGTNAIIGSQASNPLSGNITGAGLVMAHNTGSGSDMNFQNFLIITNSAVGIAPYIYTNFPLSVTVASGGGASFGVSTFQGTPPFTYGWTTNGIPVYNGNGVSGATTPTLTLSGVNSGYNGITVVAFVTNSAGQDESDSTFAYVTTLTVTNPAVGVIYDEAFPFVGPVAGNYALSSVGWVAAAAQGNILFNVTPLVNQGAVFAFSGTPSTAVYYATTTTDTNQSGLPFPNVNLAGYSSMNFSVDIAPTFASSNVTAYLAVQLGANWYVAASPLPVPTSSDSSTYATYTTAFNPAAANWKNLTVTGAGGIIGSPAASKLSGVMTGAGLVIVTIRTGGTFDFANFVVTGNGVGALNVGSPAGGKANLTWVGNPAVKLQSNTNLNSSVSWQDVPNTYGLYSLPVTTTGPQKYYRLKSP